MSYAGIHYDHIYDYDRLITRQQVSIIHGTGQFLSDEAYPQMASPECGVSSGKGVNHFTHHKYCGFYE